MKLKTNITKLMCSTSPLSLVQRGEEGTFHTKVRIEIPSLSVLSKINKDNLDDVGQKPGDMNSAASTLSTGTWF